MKIRRLTSNQCGGFRPPKGHMDTQMYPECEGTETDRNIVKKTVEKRKKLKKKRKKAFNLVWEQMMKKALREYDVDMKVPGRGLPMVSTQGVMAKFPKDELLKAIQRFKSKDFGELSATDMNANMESLEQSEQGYILASYVIDGKKLWIICDGVAVTLLLPEEY